MFPFLKPQPQAQLDTAAERAAVATLKSSSRALASHLSQAANRVKQSAIRYRQIAEEWLG